LRRDTSRSLNFVQLSRLDLYKCPSGTEIVVAGGRWKIDTRMVSPVLRPLYLAVTSWRCRCDMQVGLIVRPTRLLRPHVDIPEGFTVCVTRKPGLKVGTTVYESARYCPVHQGRIPSVLQVAYLASTSRYRTLSACLTRSTRSSQGFVSLQTLPASLRF